MSVAILTALRAMSGPDVGLGLTDPRAPEQGLLQPEMDAIAHAIPKRRREFAAGRRAARAAMAELGLPSAPVLVGPQREPLWPEGLTGSIAHCATLCIAAVSQTHQSLGIDLETASPLPADLEEIVCTKAERAWLDMLSPETRGLAAKKIFSAKEAIYKAQYPLTGQVIGFEAVELRPSETANGFELQFVGLTGSETPLLKTCNVCISKDLIFSVCDAQSLDFNANPVISTKQV